MQPSDQPVPVDLQELIDNVLEYACSEFDEDELNEDDVESRYLAMIMFVRSSLYNVKADQVAQVEKGLFVLVQKYMKSSRGDKNKVI